MSLIFEEGDYLASYKFFFTQFTSHLNPSDQLPVKTCRYDVSEGEIVGEIIDITLQYLNQKFCPPSLQTHVVRLVIDEVKSMCKEQPEKCGFKPYENTYGPLKLMQAVISKVNDICIRYLDNSRLALLPPPPSTPLPFTTCYAIKNTRRHMEDRSVILHDLNTMFSIKDDSVVNYYAVFDGHGGQDAAVYCAAHLHQYLVESPHYPTNSILALKDAFATTDARFIQKEMNSGSTAVCALLINKTLYIAWAGDSQAALIKSGSCEQLVNSHKPDREDEKKRIESLGGYVMHFGVWRVNGNLNVSRSIGDRQYKPLITSEPEILTIPLDGSEDFLIIACDGFWDCVDEKQAASILYEIIQWSPQNFQNASKYLVQKAKNLQSQDNISVIVIFLTHPEEIATKLKQHRSSSALRMDPDSPQDVQNPTNFNAMSSRPFDISIGRDEDPETIHAVDMGCCPFAMNFSKQPNQQTNGSMHIESEKFIYDNSTNGKHENGSADYDDDDDDDDDGDDLGPETDVDAVDDASAPIGKISRELFPEKFAAENDNFQKGDNLDDSQNSIDSKSRENELLPEADNVADSEDSEDEWNYYRVEPDKAKDSPVQVNETSSESKEEKDASSPKPLIEHDSENEDSKEDSHCDSKSETETKSQSSELLDKECGEKPIDLSNEEPLEEEDKMDSSLNPDAAEFTPHVIYPQHQIIQDYPVAGSPLKQTQQVMDNIDVPSEEEFEKEISARPRDMDDVGSPLSKPLEHGLDDSEISSTKAEFGDESTTSFLTTSEFQRTGVSAMDYSFADSDRDDYDIHKDPMAMSFTPGDFEAAFEKDAQLDLNAVHDLTDVDFSDVNGFENNSEKPSDECEKKDSVPPFVEESEAQASPNPFNMDTLRETLNEENMRSVKYSEIGSDNVDDACLIDTNVVSLSEDSPKIESENNSQYRDFPFETNSQVTDLLNTSFDTQHENQTELINVKQEEIIEKSVSQDQCLLENKNFEILLQSDFDNERQFENKESEFENKESVIENKESVFENKESEFENGEKQIENVENHLNKEIHFVNEQNLFVKKENQECFFENKEFVSDNKECIMEHENIVENKQILLENSETLLDNHQVLENKENLFANEENLLDTPMETPDFEIEVQTRSDFEFDPEIQEKSQTQFELSLEEDHLQNEALDLGKFSVKIETDNMDANVFEQKTNYTPVLNLSESLQEFTGLERQINEIKELENTEFTHVSENVISKENENLKENLVDIETLKIEEPKNETVVAATIAGAAAVAATAAAVTATKKPSAPALKTSTTKTSTSSKAPVKSNPTSPTKTARTTTAAAAAAAKKPATGTISRPKQLDTKQTTSTTSKSAAAFKAAPVPKTSTTAPKITPRLTATAAKPKTPISSPKPGDKKSTLNGDVKSLASKPTVPKSTTLKPAGTSVTRTNLVKSSVSARTSSTVTSKPKSAISVTAKVSSTAPRTATATTRPKTAPATTGSSAGAAKPRVPAVKSPMIDKQIKETANKQISSRVTSAPLKTSRPPTTTTTMTVKRTSTLKTATATSPIKKASAPTKTSTKPSTITKSNGKTLTKSSKPVLQNGNCVIKKVESVTTTTTATTNIEEDVPKKDISPIAPPTDNQLITSE